jgi:phosphate uptake regulator
VFGEDNVFAEQLRELGIKYDPAKEDYDRLVGVGKAQPTKEDLEAELVELARVTSKIVKFADKVVAHHDKEKPDELPKFSEIDDAIRYFENQIRRYRLLFDATSMSTDVAFQYDWKAIFRVPWIP